jgi:hypothetical protein
MTNPAIPQDSALSAGLKKKISDSEVAENSTDAVVPAAKEIGGRGGLDPTRFGDWEKNGRCIDF